MKQSYPRHLMVTALVLLLLTAFLLGYRAHDIAPPAYATLATPAMAGGMLDTTLTLRPVELFQEALQQLQAQYVDPIEQPNKLVHGAIRGMLATLNDPYTRYMDPKEFAEFNSDTQGAFAGIGATLNMVEIPPHVEAQGTGTIPIIECPVCSTQIKDVKHYRVAVVEPLPGTPAMAAGVQAGDFIMKVNDESTDGLTVGEVAEKIRGPRGTTVQLTIARKGIDDLVTINIVRDRIEVPSLSRKMLDDKIGYIHLLTFNDKTYTEMREALEWLKKEDATGLVLDLRNNPGGLLRQCIMVAGMFLPEKDRLIVSTKTRKGREETYNRSGQQIWERPLVVLVNKGSASASEILSGALKDYKRAQLVGETTFGKALVQTIIPLSDRSAMAITTAHYYTPSGHDVGRKGVAPNVTVELAKGTTALNEKDNQAETAIRILKDELAKR